MPLPRGRRPAAAGARRRRSAAAPAPAARWRARADRGGDLLLHGGAAAEPFGGGDAALRLVNPISADLDVMRPSLLPNLIAAAGRNADRGLARCRRCSRSARSMRGDRPEQQAMVAAGIRAGRSRRRATGRSRRARSMPSTPRPTRWRCSTPLGVPVDKLRRRGRCAGLVPPRPLRRAAPRAEAVLARFGEIHPRVLRALDVAGPIVAFEVFLDALPAKERRRGAGRRWCSRRCSRSSATSPSSSIGRSPAEAVVRAARAADRALISRCPRLRRLRRRRARRRPKSVAISVTLQPTDADPDRRRDRGRQHPHRRPGRQGDRRHPARLTRNE